jgi:hypothetical protein
MPESNAKSFSVPDKLRCGASVIYLSLPSLCKDWQCPEAALRQYLDDFGIPIVTHPNGGEYVSLYPLESVMFLEGLPVGWQHDEAGLPTVHQELAGVLYGAATREIVKSRVRALVRAMRKE